MNNLLVGLDNIQINLVITLVHGTWGRGVFPKIRVSSKPRWFEPQGKFRKNLTAELEKAGYNCTFNVFEWSGSNSIMHRDDAAKNLTHLLEKSLILEEIYHILIAHSHGGNVVSRAMSMLDRSFEQTGIIFLATPFLQLFPRKVGRIEYFVLTMSISLIFYIPMIIISVIPFFMVEFYWPNIKTFETFNSRLVNFVTMFITIVISQRFLFGLSNSKRADRNQSSISATSCDNLSGNHDPILILRAIDDEASLALSAGTIANLLSLKILMMLIVLGVILSNIDGSIFAKLFGGSVEAWDATNRNLGMIIFATNFIVLACAAASRSVFGRELLLNKPGTQMNTQTVPDFITKCDIKTMLRHHGSGSSSLRHGIYDHPEAGSSIVKWIDKTLKLSIKRRRVIQIQNKCISAKHDDA